MYSYTTKKNYITLNKFDQREKLNDEVKENTTQKITTPTIFT
jgi:hypothetical protein